MAKKPSTAVAPAKSNLPANYEDRLNAQAAAITSQISKPSGDRVRMKGNQAFVSPDGVEGPELEVVVLGFTSANLFYEGNFNPSAPQPPGCFAIGLNPTEMVPSENSPNKQSDSCSVCPMNQFGSDPGGGKGKACKNTRLLAMMAADADDPDAPIAILSVPPTSIKNFDAFAQSVLSKFRKPPIGVVAKITLDQSVTFASPRFEVVRALDKAELGFFMDRQDEAMERLKAEPDVTQYTPPKAQGRGKPAPAPVRGKR